MLTDALIAPFTEFEFMRRALAAVVALSLGAAPIGAFLMLRRMSLVGDAMAHAILPGAAIGFLLSGLNLFAMTTGGLIAGFAVALLSGLVSRSTGLKEDASLATFYLASLAIGVTIVSRSEEHTSELQSRRDVVCRLLLEKKNGIFCDINGNYECVCKGQTDLHDLKDRNE